MSGSSGQSGQNGHTRRHSTGHGHSHHSHNGSVGSGNNRGKVQPGLVDGSTIGNYQIVKTLGEGSFGKVKLAFHRTTNQRVALKIINKKILAKSDMQGRIEREISYLRLLRHPHIIKLYDVIKSKDEIIMVIEYADNELFDYIVQRDKMSENEARKFFQQIISAIEYCHRHKIVHRDLKPENLLLDEQSNVKIADFGLSNIMTDGNFLKTSCGSPNYAAPEVISGKLYAGPEVDVWSCGVILYVMLCRRLPFDDDSIPVLFKNISNGIYTLPKFLSTGAASLIKKMLIVNPLNRISITEIMEDEWFKVDFPDYLRLQDYKSDFTDDNSNKEDVSNEINDELVDALSKTMGYEKHEIYESLQSTVSNPAMSEIRDAYLLIRDNKFLMKELSPAGNDALDTLLSQSLPSFQKKSSPDPLSGHTMDINSQNQNHKHIISSISQQRTPVFLGQTNEEDSTVAILPTSLPQIHRANILASDLPTAASITPLVTKRSKTKWHFGIRSRSYPLDVMGEIYIALKNLGAEWAKPSEEDLWTIRVRWKYDAGQNKNNESIPDLMKIVIQLFQIETNNYLVDFKFDGWENSSGITVKPSNITVDEMCTFSAYPFLHLTTRLIMELAVNSQSG